MISYPITPVPAPRTNSRDPVNGRMLPVHGKRGTVEYRIWSDMLNRCRNARVKSYPNYGGRGISVCDRWKRFENFLADMGERPSPDHSIDRIDVNGNYQPDNARWILKSEQQSNQRNNRVVEYMGQKMTIAQLARAVGKQAGSISKRLKRGLSVKEAISFRDRNMGRLHENV